jgi:hypothetical protein
MGSKKQTQIVFNWQATNPATGFLPLNNNTQAGSIASGTLAGAMASTNTIYSQIANVSQLDNIGLEVTWTGSPVGTFSVMGSNSGINFEALTFTPALAQPVGSADGYLINLQQYPFTYLMLEYTNTSGTGTITVYGQGKDLN